MTVLQRTDLTTSQKIECAAAAVARQHEHGSKTELSETYEISRPTVYAVGAAAQSVLRAHFEAPLLGGAGVAVRVDDAQLRRAVVALRVMAPNAIRPIEDLLPVLYPGVRVSYGTIQSMLVEAEGRAARFNAGVSLDGVKAGALDELFSQGEPVLAGVDLDSGYLFGLSLSATRDGDAWAGLLREGQGLGLEVVVKDAAKGIAAGVSEVFPDAEQRDDCFHVLYEMHKVRRKLERRAYAAIEREGEALARLGKIRACERQRRRKAKCALSKARRQCTEAIERFDTFEAAMGTLRGALDCVDLATGELHRPEAVEARIAQVAQRIASLGGGECTKIARYLRNRAPGLVLAQKSVLPRLEALGEEDGSMPAVGWACLCWYWVRELRKRPPRVRHRALSLNLLGAYGALHDRLGAEGASRLCDAVGAVLIERHRASSAIEGFNATLRPYLYVHKGVTQGFLELFRAWFNLRTRRWGRHKRTSAHECLTGQRVGDWLTRLGYPPSPALA